MSLGSQTTAASRPPHPKRPSAVERVRMREPRASTVSRLFPGARLSCRSPSRPLGSVLGLLRRRLVFSSPLPVILEGEEEVEKGATEKQSHERTRRQGAGRRASSSIGSQAEPASSAGARPDFELPEDLARPLSSRVGSAAPRSPASGRAGWRSKGSLPGKVSGRQG